MLKGGAWTEGAAEEADVGRERLCIDRGEPMPTQEEEDDLLGTVEREDIEGVFVPRLAVDGEAFKFVGWQCDVGNFGEADFLQVCKGRKVLVMDRVAVANLDDSVGEFESVLGAPVTVVRLDGDRRDGVGEGVDPF